MQHFKKLINQKIMIKWKKSKVIQKIEEEFKRLIWWKSFKSKVFKLLVSVFSF